MPQEIGADFIRAINKRLGNRLQFVPGPWKKIYLQVQNQQLDDLMDRLDNLRRIRQRGFIQD
jgi:hypothetical protein